MNEPMTTTYEFRPFSEFTDLRRYNNGLWTPDDGEFDIVFVGRSIRGFPITLYVDIPVGD